MKTRASSFSILHTNKRAPLRSIPGFTIVELLIVIVVIAILAAITIVAYNGIQNRANDSAVQSDIRNIRQQALLYQVDSPQGGYPTASQLQASGGVRVSKGSYLTTNNAMLYCAPLDGSTFAIIGKSKSGVTYYASSAVGVQIAPFSFPLGSALDCSNAGSTNAASGWIHALSSGWVSWAQG